MKQQKSSGQTKAEVIYVYDRQIGDYEHRTDVFCQLGKGGEVVSLGYVTNKIDRYEGEVFSAFDTEGKLVINRISSWWKVDEYYEKIAQEKTQVHRQEQELKNIREKNTKNNNRNIER